MRISEIFLAHEGEGIHIGRLQVFVRFQGCQVACLSCDSTYTWNPVGGKETSISAIVKEVQKIGKKVEWVSLTGGCVEEQPQKEVLLLTEKLGKKINLEATGVYNVPELFKQVDFISCDIKTPSSGVVIDPDLLKYLGDRYKNKIQFKAVVKDEKDLNCVLSFKELPNVVITPCWTERQTTADLKFIKHILEVTKGYPEIKVIIQQHKLVFGSKKRGV